MASRDDQLMVMLNLTCKLPHMSASALAAIIGEFKKSGAPSLGGRKNIRMARENLVNRGTPYGQLHQTVSVMKKTGGATRLVVQHLFAVLHLATEDSGEFASFLEKRYDEHPCSVEDPWNLVFYVEEVTPGAALKHDNLRKMQAHYWSFLEFGPAALAKEICWFVYTSKRSSEVRLLKGGMIQVFKVMLEMFLATHHNIELAGVVLVLPSGRRIRIYAVINAFVMDEAAHKEIWGCKGASGLKNCMLCMHHTKLDHGLPGYDSYFQQYMQDARRFDLHTDATLKAVMRRLQREVNSGGDVEALQIQLGWVYDDQNLLLNGEQYTNIQGI